MKNKRLTFFLLQDEADVVSYESIFLSSDRIHLIVSSRLLKFLLVTLVIRYPQMIVYCLNLQKLIRIWQNASVHHCLFGLCYKPGLHKCQLERTVHKFVRSLLKPLQQNVHL